jgi:hypothetical protein
MIVSIIGILCAGAVSSTLLVGLFAVYKAESNANDSYTNALNGTAVGGLTYGAGKSGNAFIFNGSSYVKLSNSSFNSLTGDFSVSLWFYGNGSGVTQSLFSNNGYNGTTSKGFFLYQKTTYEIVMQINGSGGNTLLQTASALSNSTWHNIVVTRLGSTQTSIYLNGVLSASNTDTRNPDYYTNNTPCIGGLDYNPNFAIAQYFCANGTKIDEVSVYTKELTSTEVTTLYNSGAGKFYPTF